MNESIFSTESEKQLLLLVTANMAAVALPSMGDTPIKMEPDSKTTLTPPASEEADKLGDVSSELSELDFDLDDIGDIEPDHYYEGGRIPVFKPVRNAIYI